MTRTTRVFRPATERLIEQRLGVVRPRTDAVRLLRAGQENTERWLTARSATIGASEIGILMMAEHPYHSRFSLWHVKADRWGGFPQTDQQERGHLLEPGIARRFAAAHPRLIVAKANGGLWGDPQLRALSCTPDYLTIDESGLVAPLELKGLATDTRLPTPTGWTTMAQVQAGDQLIGSDGQPCTVTATSDVRWVDCYRLTFDDGTSVVCDGDHRWRVDVGTNGRRRHGQIVTAREIAAGVRNAAGRHRFRVPLAGPMETGPANLPVDPYTLGCWLGDGAARAGRITGADPELFDYITASSGLPVGPDIAPRESCPTRTVYGLETQLRLSGLLRNKHIPDEYQRASVVQRLELLRGLMDTDGTYAQSRRQAVFATVDKALAVAVEELVGTLGERPVLGSHRGYGFGKEVTVWKVQWRPMRYVPFRLLRKADKVVISSARSHTVRRLIVSAVPVPTVPTRCVAVDSADHTYLCTERFLPTHNSDEGGDWDGDEPPVHHRWQVWQQSGIFAAPYGYLARWSSRGYRDYLVPYDHERYCRGAAEAQAFLATVAAGTPPPVDAHRVTGEVLRDQHPYPIAPVLPVEVPADWGDDLDALKEARKQLDAQVKHLDNQIRQAMGDAAFGWDAGGRSYARTRTPRKAYTVKASTIDQIRTKAPPATEEQTP